MRARHCIECGGTERDKAQFCPQGGHSGGGHHGHTHIHCDSHVINAQTEPKHK